MALYFTIKDGKAVPVDQLPDLSTFKSNLDGLCYCSSEETLPDGHKSLRWEQCKIFSVEEVDQIDKAAVVMERLFENLFRLDAAKEAFLEYKDQLKSSISGHSSEKAVADRRFRAFILEWKLFLDHWKNYIENGAQTKYWANQSDAGKYIDGYKRLYKDLIDEAEKCDAFVVAWAIRNHVAHADNAIGWFPVDQNGAKALIAKSVLLERCNSDRRAEWQRDAIERQPDMIDLTAIGEQALAEADKIMEGLLQFQIDGENTAAASTLLNAQKRIEEAGIKADRWIIFFNNGMEWTIGQEAGVIQRVADENGNPVIEEPQKVNVIVPGMVLGYRPLNWLGYVAFASYFGNLYKTGKWEAIQKTYWK